MSNDSVAIDRHDWSADGECTALVVDALAAWPAVASLRVADAPAGRDGEGYNFLATDVFVTPRVRRAGLPFWRPHHIEAASMDDLVAYLSGVDRVGPPAYADADMLQYLFAQRIRGPYQSRGIKVVEMVRVYLGRLQRPASS